jgi:hypothetical protein
MKTLTPLLLLALAACSSSDKPATTDTSGGDTAGTDTASADCDPAADTDGDGLDDCTELEELGTDPGLADSDGDGDADGAEVDCASDPLDSAEGCYACGWTRADPGDLVSEGDDIGDVIENLELVDQCEELVDLWDFAGEYHVLFLTAAW